MTPKTKQAAAYVAVFTTGFGVCAGLVKWAGAGQSAPASPLVSRAEVLPVLAASAPKRTPSSNLSAPPHSPVADAAARVAPSVVSIDVAGGTGARGPFSFLQNGSDDDEIEGAGSGIIFSSDGLVVTNNHVIEPVAGPNGGEVIVRLPNGTEYRDVSIVGRDEASDLAVLQINGVKNLPAAPLGNSNTLRVGDWSIAIGNPMGFNSTVTLGIVSAINRQDFRPDLDALAHVIQTDAAINPGNSGGALVDIGGRVVGINTAIASSTGASVGIGFAIPINTAKSVMYQLVQSGKVARPYLGVMYSPVAGVDTSDLPKGIKLPPDNKGAILTSDEKVSGPCIIAGSPAARAGLQKWDVIREIAGRTVEGVGVIKEEVQNHRVGETLPLTVWRSGKTLHLSVRLDPMPAEYARVNRARRSLLGLPPYLVPSPHRPLAP